MKIQVLLIQWITPIKEYRSVLGNNPNKNQQKPSNNWTASFFFNYMKQKCHWSSSETLYNLKHFTISNKNVCNFHLVISSKIYCSIGMKQLKSIAERVRFVYKDGVKFQCPIKNISSWNVFATVSTIFTLIWAPDD